MAKITLKNIKKVYSGGGVAVSDFNLEIEDNEFIVLVGPSGCGKSTTLRLIAGLEEITEGEIWIGDRLVNEVPPKDRDIAMVFQNYALYPHMTAYKNMAFGLESRKTPREVTDGKVREAAAILGIEDILERKPKAMSGGQRQRVALGRAIVRDPEVFLLDEPLSNLDAKLRASTRAEIIKLHKRLGATFIYVTHDQIEAVTMGDRIVVMKDGFVQQADTPRNLFKNPCNMFVAGFIGSPTMNFLEAEVARDESGFSLVVGGEKAAYAASGKDLSEYVGKTLVLGIRPEDVAVSAGGGLAAKVDVAEPVSSETYLYLECSAGPLTAKVPGIAPVRPGDSVFISFSPDKLYFFDKETEAAI